MGSHVVRGYRDHDSVDWNGVLDLIEAEHEDLNRRLEDSYDLLRVLRSSDLFLVAREGRHITGFVALRREKGSRHEHIAHLRLHVTREYRSNGVGKKLLQRALWWADRNGVERLVAMPYIQDSYLSNEATRFFLRHGFEVEGYQRRAARLLDGSLTDVALMARVVHPAKEDN